MCIATAVSILTVKGCKMATNVEWKNVQRTEKGQEYVAPCLLSSGPRSNCKALFFRNKHASSGEMIVSLKIARQTKKNGKFTTNDGKSLTLRPDELNNLIQYIQEYYTPLNAGMKEFIEADKDAAALFTKVRELGISDEEVVQKLYESGVLTKNLSIAITAAERSNAISEFEAALAQDSTESFWQSWFANNKWILGSEYLNILPERDIDTRDIADYLMRSVDGYLDVVEIKRPSIPLWAGPDSHGNYYPSSQLSSAVAQCLNYLYRIELQSNSIEFLERVEGTRTVHPTCMLVFGRSNDWDEHKNRSLRIYNASFHNLHIITYDQLLVRAKQLLGFPQEDPQEDDDLPF